MSYTLHPAAEAELLAAASYYAVEASSRVAEAFLTEFERVARVLQDNQRLGTPARGGLRAFRFLRFPYSVIYRESPAGPAILAIAHQRRQPGYWKRRR